MQYIHVKNLEKYHPGYRDRNLIWAKIYTKMVQGDPDCEMITNEIDWARLIKFILLELQAQKPIPLNPIYLTRKGFDLKKRSIELTLKELHTFIELRNETVTESLQIRSLDKRREDKSKIECNGKNLFLEFVYLTNQERTTLVERFGEAETKEKISRLNDYIGAKGTKYKSHYHTICMWESRNAPPIKKKIDYRDFSKEERERENANV